MMRAFVLLVALLVLVVIVNSGATETTTVHQHGHGRHSHNSTSLPWVAEAYTHTVRYDSTQHTLSYGSDEALGAMRHAPLLPDGTYGEVVRSMPLVCVDVLLQRADGRFLLLLRHAEPVKGLWWWPGGRLNFGESFADAALRKVKKEVGLHACFRQVLGTWNTLFERSAWSSPTQTVNILVHATIDDAAASKDDGEVIAAQDGHTSIGRHGNGGLHICGDERGACPDTGRPGRYRWVSIEEASESAYDTYIVEGAKRLAANPLRFEEASQCSSGGKT